MFGIRRKPFVRMSPSTEGGSGRKGRRRGKSRAVWEAEALRMAAEQSAKKGELVGVIRKIKLLLDEHDSLPVADAARKQGLMNEVGKLNKIKLALAEELGLSPEEMGRLMGEAGE